MDFNTLGQQLASTTYEHHVLSPKEAPLYVDDSGNLTTDKTERPVILRIVGRDSPAFRKREREIFNWRQSNGRKKVKHSEAEQQAIETVAAAVVGWENVPLDGELPEFSQDALQKFLTVYRPAFDQLNEAIDDRGNFSPSV